MTDSIALRRLRELVDQLKPEEIATALQYVLAHANLDEIAVALRAVYSETELDEISATL
jgi:hypothetical protein